MDSTQTVLVTGATRSIGREFTLAYLKRPSTTVIAAVDAAIYSDAAEAVNKVQKDFSIDSLDIVIANAWISHSGASILDMSVVAATEHFKISVLGPVILLQATVPLLRTSKLEYPKFVAISSNIRTIGGADSLHGVSPILSPYEASKTALNWFVKRLHAEEEWLISFVFHLGLVSTELTQQLFASAGMILKGMEAISVEESVQGMMETIDTASQDTSGTFRYHTSQVLPW